MPYVPYSAFSWEFFVAEKPTLWPVIQTNFELIGADFFQISIACSLMLLPGLSLVHTSVRDLGIWTSVQGFGIKLLRSAQWPTTKGFKFTIFQEILPYGKSTVKGRIKFKPNITRQIWMIIILSRESGNFLAKIVPLKSCYVSNVDLRKSMLWS